MYISEHISYKEVIRSSTAVRLGIANIPNSEQLENIKLIAEKIFEPLRNFFGKKIYISSFFRCVLLNTKIGGAENSQHCALKGEAAIDLDADVFKGLENFQIFRFIKENLKFDKLIWEFGDFNNPAWVHVSYNKDNNRNIILISYKKGKKTKYINYE